MQIIQYLDIVHSIMSLDVILEEMNSYIKGNRLF